MNVTSKHGLGNHYIFDGFGCRCKGLGDENFVKDLLSNLSSELGFTKLSEPQSIYHEAENKEESGASGFIIISESHISIHTYPFKNYVSVDIFSCKEYDLKKARTILEKAFLPDNVEENLLKRGHTYGQESNLPEVQPIRLKKGLKASDLVSSLENAGFQATHLARAVNIIKNMRKDNAKIFLTFTSNMVSSGLREVFALLVKEKMVDAIITSIGSVEEDLIKSKKPFLLGRFDADDTELHKKGINRIGNIFVPNDCYELLEDFLAPFFAKMLDLQKKSQMLSPSKIIHELGNLVDDKDSILYWASKNNIPIFCPAPTDGAFGLQLYFFKQKHPEFGIDVSADMKHLADIVLNAEKTGAIILGGGFAKHHTIGVNILRGGLDYAVYVCTASQYDGSLSGARTSEAISWSKINETANTVYVEADATIAFPLIAAAWLENE